MPGEKRRERVLSDVEEDAFLTAAVALGDSKLTDYQEALEGIRATQRGEQPIKPEDPHLLRDVAILLLDCGLRPEECYRLRWEHGRTDTVFIPHGKTANARRKLPRSERVMEMLGRKQGGQSEWVFPAATSTATSSSPPSRGST